MRLFGAPKGDRGADQAQVQLQVQAPRRRPALLVAGILVVVPIVAAVGGQLPEAPASECGPGSALLREVTGPPACTHVDEAPPGVDVTEHR
jgi:hypothetical protein